MRKDHDVFRALVRETLLGLKETLKPQDVAVSKQPIRHDVSSHGMGAEVRVTLNGKSWITRSQTEVDRVLKLGGKIVKAG